LKRAVDQKEHTGAYGYIHSDAILKKEETSSRPTFRRVLLQFSNRDIEFHEVDFHVMMRDRLWCVTC
jgi:hypothetical protein